MLLLLSGFLLQSSVHAEDKIRIGFPGVAANFLSVPLGQKKGFFQEEGLQVEYIRMDAGLPGISKRSNRLSCEPWSWRNRSDPRHSGQGRSLLRTQVSHCPHRRSRV